MKIILKSLLIASTLIVSSGCLEHRYFISVLPDQSLNVHYELRGDRPDIEDGYELLPDSTLWGLKRTVEETEEQTTHIYAGDRTLAKTTELVTALNWSKGPDDSVYFKPEITLTPKKYLFVRIWTFEALFTSRKFTERYGDMWEYVPEECRVLEDSEAMESVSTDESTILERKFGLGVIQWTRARYEQSFDATWNIAIRRDGLLRDTTETTKMILRTAWVADIHAYLNGLDVGNPQTANLNWWKDLRQMLLGRFVEIVDVHRIDELGRIADGIEKSYLISKDLEDDNFIVEANAPGRIIKTNGSHENGTVRWEIPGKDFQNENQLARTVSVEPDWAQISIGIAAVGLGVFVLRRKREK